MTIGSVISRLPQLTRLWQLDSDAPAELTAADSHLEDEVVHRHRLAATPDSTATVIHTSGTTGRPRGCVITHGNFIFETETMVGRWEPGFRSRLGSTGNAHRMVLVDGA